MNTRSYDFDRGSSYSFGLGAGLIMGALFTMPGGESSATKNLWVFIGGVVIVLVGGILQAMGRRKK